MQEFQIFISSFQQIQAFVELAMEQPFDVLVGNERQNINGKDLMGMSTLDYRYPLKVTVSCSEDEFSSFRQAAAPYWA